MCQDGYEPDELEITPEMIEAGRQFFARHAPDAEEMMSAEESGVFVQGMLVAMVKAAEQAPLARLTRHQGQAST